MAAIATDREKIRRRCPSGHPVFTTPPRCPPVRASIDCPCALPWHYRIASAICNPAKVTKGERRKSKDEDEAEG